MCCLLSGACYLCLTPQNPQLRKCPCLLGRCCVYVCGCMCVCMCCCCYPFFCYCLINIIKTFVSFYIHWRQHFSLSFFITFVYFVSFVFILLSCYNSAAALSPPQLALSLSINANLCKWYMNVYICIYILNLLMQIVCMYVCIFVYKVLRIAICLRFVLLILFPTCQMVFVFLFVFGFFCFFLRNARFFFPFSTMFVYIIILFSSKLKHKFTLFNLLLLLLLLLNLHTIVVNFFNNNNNAFVFFLF